MSSTKTSTQKHVKALNTTTKDALTKIRNELKPFIRQLDSDNVQKKAQAQAVVALSMGTLRYMGARLQGKSEGKEDPLRQELDHMRKVLVELEAKHKKTSTTSTSSKQTKVATPAKKVVKKDVEETKEVTAKSPAKSKKRPTPTKEKKSTPGRSAKKSRKTWEQLVVCTYAHDAS